MRVSYTSRLRLRFITDYSAVVSIHLIVRNVFLSVWSRLKWYSCMGFKCVFIVWLLCFDTVNWNWMYAQAPLKWNLGFMYSILFCLTGLSHTVGTKPMWHDSTRHEEADDFLV